MAGVGNARDFRGGGDTLRLGGVWDCCGGKAQLFSDHEEMRCQMMEIGSGTLDRYKKKCNLINLKEQNGVTITFFIKSNVSAFSGLCTQRPPADTTK